MKSKRDYGLPQSMKVRRLPQKISAPATILESDEEAPLQLWPLIKKYFLLGVLLVAAGTIGGMCLVLFQTPIYKARILLEVQPLSSTVLQNGMDPFASLFSMDSASVQTEVRLLDSGPFRGRVMEQMAGMAPPPPAPANDFFGRLRMYIRPSAERRATSVQNALEVAATSFTVTIVNETRLIELSCESPHPVITSEYLNNIANMFIDDAIRSRSDASEKTNAWLSSHIDDTRAKLQDADSRLRTFVLRSGNIFAAADATVDDVKLKGLQAQLATAQMDRLAKQAAYESAVRSGNYQSLQQVVSDPIAATTRGQIAELERQKGILLTTLTPQNPKVLALQEQERQLEASLNRSANDVVGRLKTDYEAATDHERLLLKAYEEESGQVTAQASKAAEYAALRREVDELQKRYDSLLQELSRTQVAQSAPVIPLRLVERSEPPATPYKPKPETEVILGVIAGLASTFGVAFFREKMDRSLGSPEAVQALVRVPQLGVVPAAHRLPKLSKVQISPIPDGAAKPRLIPASPEAAAAGIDSGHVARAAWEDGSIAMADSFRAILASISRHLGTSHESRIIIVTSSTPGAGKTTVVSNLGIALSETGRRAIIVDADFRRPRLSKVFGSSTQTNFASLLLDDRPVDEYTLDEISIPTSFPGLRILPAHDTPPNVATLIYSERLPRVFDRLSREFDVVLVDVPPILFPADARVIAEYCHGVVLVIRAGHCAREGISAAVKCLHEDGVPILGTVLNGWVPSGPKSGMRYYNYYYNQEE
jgi:capsular exopolysaccharide synthesis family protein